MALSIEILWNRRQKLHPTAGGCGYAVDLELVPDCPGIYIFLRERSEDVSKYEALYVGKAENLRRRIGQYFSDSGTLHARRVMRGVTDAPPGARWLIFGELNLRQGQQLSGVLKVTETALIRYYTDLDHRLVNRKRMQPKRHVIELRRRFLRDFIPGELAVEERGSHQKRKANIHDTLKSIARAGKEFLGRVSR